jgi:hypothetical protein
MTIEEFVKAVKIQTSDATIKGTLKSLSSPPGRKPRAQDVHLSQWYNRLNSTDRQRLGEALREAAELAVFSFFCVLDGVSVVEATPDKGEVEIYFVKGSERIRLNDPHREELHNVFNGMCQEDLRDSLVNSEIKPYESGEAQDLRAKLVPGGDIDIHHVPDKYLSAQAVTDYDPKRAPAMALPKPEHRKVPPPSSGG